MVKGLGQGYVLREDGSTDSLPNVIEANKFAWQAQYGKLTPEVVAYAQTVPPEELIDLSVAFDPLEDWPTYLSALESGDEVLEQEQSNLLKDSIAEKSALIIEALEAAGAVDVQASVWSPFISFRVAQASLPLIQDLPEAARIIGNATLEAEEQANNVVANPATFHNVSAVSSNFTGDGERVGMIEPGVCRIRENHPLVAATVNYSNAGANCSTSADCTLTKCGNASIPHACVSGKCRDGHGTATTSVLTRFLPDAAIWYPNGGTGPEGPVCSRQITTTYDYLRTSLVRYSNESFSCNDQISTLSPTDGVVQDYFSRAHNFFITKSAGNDGEGSAACKSTWNSLCVGSIDAEQELSCFSSTDNPFYGAGSLTIDREEPDVMAYGGQLNCPSGEEDTVVVASPVSIASTVNASGTSYAAPAMLGMAVLVDEYCDSLNLNWNSVGYRSVLRTAGYVSNPDGWKYSTLQDGSTQAGDHADGGGAVFLDSAIKFCNPPPSTTEEWGVRQTFVYPDKDGSTTNVPNTTPAYPDAPPQSAPQNQGLQPSGSLTGYRWKDLWDGLPSTYAAGTRIRATFSWEACVLSNDTAATRTVPTDFDLFLYNRTRGEGLYASQTDDDVNEGFDVVVPANWAGDYDLILIWPDGSTGCNGLERTALSWYVKKP